MTISHVRNALGIGKIGNQHAVSENTLMNLPNLLNNPEIIFENNGDINVLLNATDNNGNIILVAIDNNGNATVNNNSISSNFIKSVYGKEKIIRYYNNVLKNKNILYPQNATKKQIVMKLARLQSPKKSLQSANTCSRK